MKQEMTKKTKSTKSKSIVFSILALLFSLFIFGVFIIYILSLVNVSQVTAGLVASQVAIALYSFILLRGNIAKTLNEKITWKTILKIIGVTVLVFIANILISASVSILGELGILQMNAKQISEQTHSILDNHIGIAMFLTVGTAPIFEELAFRAGLKYTLVDKGGWSKKAYVVISSLIFGLLHIQPGFPEGFVPVLVTGAMGTILSINYIRENNIWITIGSHMLYNGIIIALALIL